MCLTQSASAYPNGREIGKAAEALVVKHPCLKEAGSDTGWNGWMNSIKFKMGNYRTRRAGWRRRKRNLPLIDRKMQTTFALRRQGIVTNTSPVKEFLDLWPALRVESQSEVVVIDLPRLLDAFLVMFGLIYALHLSYPKELSNTFEFIQKILLGLEDGKLKPRLQALNNYLMIHV
ncbi:unnamed protein product [Coregonus sp. 'balchen']|nr:unnamed protein product [Coregonus sp. 'balchen']